MQVFADQTGRTISLAKTPLRIISLVPSQTELLFDLGLDTAVIGITRFCVHPEEWFRSKKRVGGTKQLNLDIIEQLQPDLIIANKEENLKEQIEELEKKFPVWVSDISNLEDALKMIEQIGMIVNKEKQATEMITRIKDNFAGLTTNDSRLSAKASATAGLKTSYFIWQNPYMAAGGDTFIHSMMTAAGFENIFVNKKRYPEITIDELKTADCQLLLLSSEPFPFKEKHMDKIRAQGFKGQILLVDGEMFSWYGSRLLKAPAYFRRLREFIDSGF